ncbi:ankyrin repeat domain-containing protein 7-like [Physella acuta]|uniref:ankyrin repeat domain-containing protein 7-like n=1 Tax=Physella acuta TaxID=109671 RepID=UPI0027DB7B52|nr:ankyrin repeat domain-containing protein 7-like [Physella acuta]
MQSTISCNDLINASQKGQHLVVENFLKRKPNINGRDANGWTALMHAASNGFTGVIRVLLWNQADVDCTNLQQQTALMLAAMNGKTDAVRLIVPHSAKINAKDFEGKTALEHAKNQNIVKILKEYVPVDNRKGNNTAPSNRGAVAEKDEKVSKDIAKTEYLQLKEICRLATMLGDNWQGFFLELEFSSIDISNVLKENNQIKNDTLRDLLAIWFGRKRGQITKDDVRKILETALENHETVIDWVRVKKLLG